MSGKVLITGGTGYLGQKIALHYLARSDRAVVLTVHAGSQRELEEKSRPIQAALGPLASRVELVPAELTEPEPFAGVNADQIETIVHAASVIRFNVEEEIARKVNIEGTEKILRFAKRVPNLKAFGLLSSIYASGLRAGPIPETRLDDTQGFANHYERSKWMSEELLLTHYPELPWRVFRVATVLADDDAGHVVQQNAVHNTLKLFYYGLVSVLPGDPSTPVYLVTGDLVARAVFEGLDRLPAKKIYNVCHSAAEAPTLGQLMDTAYEAFQGDERFKRRRLLKPLFSDAKAFEALVESAVAFGGDLLTQAVTSIAPFAAQLFIHKAVDNQALAQGLVGYTPPKVMEQVRNTCAFLASSKFQRYSLLEAPWRKEAA